MFYVLKEGIERLSMKHRTLCIILLTMSLAIFASNYQIKGQTIQTRLRQKCLGLEPTTRLKHQSLGWNMLRDFLTGITAVRPLANLL
uniref:Transposase n=1 Tax=Romanomermis culicivorax TaxID=13658 RepID=A0A915I3W1_ROMCU